MSGEPFEQVEHAGAPASCLLVTLGRAAARVAAALPREDVRYWRLVSLGTDAHVACADRAISFDEARCIVYPVAALDEELEDEWRAPLLCLLVDETEPGVRPFVAGFLERARLRNVVSVALSLQPGRRDEREDPLRPFADCVLRAGRESFGADFGDRSPQADWVAGFLGPFESCGVVADLDAYRRTLRRLGDGIVLAERCHVSRVAAACRSMLEGVVVAESVVVHIATGDPRSVWPAVRETFGMLAARGAINVEVSASVTRELASGGARVSVVRSRRITGSSNVR